MKIMAVIVVAALVLPACARFHRSEAINTDNSGAYASGTYSDRSSGQTGKVTVRGVRSRLGNRWRRWLWGRVDLW